MEGKWEIYFLSILKILQTLHKREREREQKRKNDAEESAKIDIIFVIVPSKSYNNVRFPVLYNKSYDENVFSHTIAKERKLHCDVYLKIIRQNDLVGINVSV